jgi:uncharacterized cofD-like protein
MTISVLGAYLPDDRESIPDVLYRRRHLDRGPKVVVIGGGTGLSNLLRGLKNYTSNITAIVTVGDDGGSSGRLREELGVLPPGDIRNCITALADEEKLVTELFRYRFEAGQGLEGHSFGNLFLTALCSITKGDMLEAVRVASRVLNSCGQVLPSTLNSVVLVAEMADGSTVRGESHITSAKGQITRLGCEPDNPVATPEALAAIADADLIILGPGSLYTSICPNLLIKGIPEALREARARKIYICNVMTQEGETTNYTVADHVQTLLLHARVTPGIGTRLINAVLVNREAPPPELNAGHYGVATPVRYDPERLKELKVVGVLRSVLSSTLNCHHDPDKLAKAIMEWFVRQKKRKPHTPRPPSSRADGPPDQGNKAVTNSVIVQTSTIKEGISSAATEQIAVVKSAFAKELGTPPGHQQQ